MERRVFKKRLFSSLGTTVGTIFFTVIIMAFVILGLRQTDEANRNEGVRLLEEALSRAVVHSYAVDGFFPESLDYITNTFGIYIDRSRFIVHYSVFATNIFPDIRVFERDR